MFKKEKKYKHKEERNGRYKWKSKRRNITRYYQISSIEDQRAQKKFSLNLKTEFIQNELKREKKAEKRSCSDFWDNVKEVQYIQNCSLKTENEAEKYLKK